MIYQYDGRRDKCPVPIVTIRVALKKLKPNDIYIVKLADRGSISDIPKYLSSKNYLFSERVIEDGALELEITTG